MDLMTVAILFIFAGIIFGAYIFLNADKAIKTQIKFYEKINWRVEPISMEKEIRSTKIMGLFLFGFCLLAIVYIKFFAVESWALSPCLF